MSEPLNSAGKQAIDKDSWEKLAEALGIGSGQASPQGSSGELPSDSAADFPTQSEKGEQPSEVGPGFSHGVESAAAANISASTVMAKATAEPVPDRIPLHRWSRRAPSGGNWDEIAVQLGLRKPESPPKEAAAPGACPVEAKGESAAEETSGGPFPAVTDWLNPAEQTVAPVPFDEALLVAVTLPPDEEEREVIQAEAVPVGEWLEEQLVALESPSVSPTLAPVVAEIVPPSTESRAVAADTATLDAGTGEVHSAVVDFGSDSGTSPKQKRRRRRRKKKSSPTPPISPEPFEEELPEIVELATTGVEANGEEVESGDLASDTKPVALEEVPEEKASKESGHASAEVAPQAGVAQEEEEIPRPSHKAVPGWAEVVGYVIQKNMEARSRRPGHGQRDRRR